MKRIEITCRELHDLLKDNIENIKDGFTDKDVKDLTWSDLMYILYYNSDNVLVYDDDSEDDVDL